MSGRRTTGSRRAGPRPRRNTMKKTGPASCDDCQARIVYIQMVATGKRIPVDPIPDDQGTVCARLIGNQLQGYVISRDHPYERPYTRYVAHFGTCDARPRPVPKPKPEPAPTLFDAEPDTCRLVEVDGGVIRVHGAGEMNDEDRAAFAEIVRAARRRYERDNP